MKSLPDRNSCSVLALQSEDGRELEPACELTLVEADGRFSECSLRSQTIWFARSFCEALAVRTAIELTPGGLNGDLTGKTIREMP